MQNDADVKPQGSGSGASPEQPQGDPSSGVHTKKTRDTHKKPRSSRVVGLRRSRLLELVITSGITATFTVLVAWLTLPIEKQKADILNALERQKAELTQEFTKPRAFAEGLSKEELEDERRTRELITAVSNQFRTVLATENVTCMAGRTESNELHQILQKSRLPRSVLEPARRFNTHVQNFLRNYSGPNIPKDDSIEVKTALDRERQLREEALTNLNHWSDAQLRPSS